MSYATILLVEDDPNYALLLGLAFRENSLQVHVQQVCDASTAIAYFQGRGRYANRSLYALPGLVVLDLHVPAVGGRALLRWVRKQRWLAGLPIVLLSDDDSTALDMETVTIKRRYTKDLVHLLGNVSLGWATRSENMTYPSKQFAVKYSSQPRQALAVSGTM